MFSTIGYYICIPFAWLLRGLYSITGSYGLALILFTLVVKLVLLPFQIKSKKSMMRMTRFQPKIKEIQAKYANNQMKMNEELQRLYAEEKINPMSGCLWSLLPFPILIALYSIIRQPLSRFMLLGSEVIEKIRATATTLGYQAAMQGENFSFYEEIGLAKFVTEHFEQFQTFVEEGLMAVNYNFLGLDLTVVPTSVLGDFFTGGWAVIGVVLIPIISAAISLFQSKVSMASSGGSGNDAAARSNRMMLWMMPIMSLYIGFTLPAALGVYWIANSVFMIAQDVPMNKYFKKAMEEEDRLREEERKNDRVRRMEEAKKQQQKQAEEQKLSLKEKQKAAASAKAAKAAKAANATTEAGRVGERPYARGRAFNPEHYGE